MGIRASNAIDLEGLERALEQWREPGAAELCEQLHRMLTSAGAQAADPTLQLTQLKQSVYRLRTGGTAGRALVLKRHTPALAQTDRLLVERWLPALGLADRCPQLLAAVAERSGSWVWHVYEDIGDDNLAQQRLPWRLEAAADCIAELHLRAARHALLPEVRWRARDHGVHFFTASIRDAIAALRALETPPRDVPREFPDARERLLRCLLVLREEAPRRVLQLEDATGPETLLHGDLWPKNVFVSGTRAEPRTRLIDWDHVGVGPAMYDVSTFLYQSAPEERPAILRRYRDRVEHGGWHLPEDGVLNQLFYTAECARYAHCVVWAATALLHDRAEWGIGELMDFEHWFRALRPPLAE